MDDRPIGFHRCSANRAETNLIIRAFVLCQHGMEVKHLGPAMATHSIVHEDTWLHNTRIIMLVWGIIIFRQNPRDLCMHTCTTFITHSLAWSAFTHIIHGRLLVKMKWKKKLWWWRRWIDKWYAFRIPKSDVI